jgi:plasmid replication initiation protein
MNKVKSTLVVKSNALVNSSYVLTLVEQRIILLAILEARESNKKITASTHVSINVKDYSEHFKVDRSTAYGAIKSAAESLFERQVTFYDQHPTTGKQRKRTTRWVSERAETEESGVIELVFAHAVIPHIGRLEKNFTSYDLEQVSGLKSIYAVRLYEMLIGWDKRGKKASFELEVLRSQLGLGVDEYPHMSNFKRRVLDLAQKQINEHTDIKVDYTPIKDGVRIAGFEFTFTKKDDQKATPKATKPKKPKVAAVGVDYSVTGFSTQHTYALKAIREYAPEITQDYVITLAKSEKITLEDALAKIQRDYRKPEDFTLTESD